MKTRTFQILNIIAINLLLLALYLNFIHKDNDTVPSIPVKETTTEQTAAAAESNPPTNTAGERGSTALN